MSHYIHSCIVPLGVCTVKEKREKLTFPFRSINKIPLVVVLTKNHSSTMNLTFTHLSIEPIFIGFNNNFQNSLRTYVCVILRYTLKSSPSPHPSHNYHVSWLTKYQSNIFLILMMRWCDKWGVCGKFQPVCSYCDTPCRVDMLFLANSRSRFLQYRNFWANYHE